MCGFILLGIVASLSKLKCSKRKIRIISIIFLSLFMFLTGFTPSCVRACIMAGMASFSKLIHRKSNTINNLCFVLLLSVIYNPYNIKNVSVLLSYGGVIRNTSFF